MAHQNITVTTDDLISLFEQRQFAEVEVKARLWTIEYPVDSFGWKMLGAALSMMQRHEEAVSLARY